MIARLAELVLLRWTRRNQYESKFLRTYFEKRYNIRVGLYTYNAFDRWRVPPGTVIGTYCSFSKSVRIIDENHSIGHLTTHPIVYHPSSGIAHNRQEVAPTVIEDDVWFGHNAIITPGCKKVGRGAILVT